MNPQLGFSSHQLGQLLFQQDDKKQLAEDDRFISFLKMSLEEKDQLTCDEVFTLYLGYVSKQVNAIYYKTVTKFVLMFRECMNQKGWIKRREFQIKSGIKMDEDPIWQYVEEKTQLEGVPDMPWFDRDEEYLEEQTKSVMYGHDNDSQEDHKMDSDKSKKEEEYGEEEMEEYGEEGEYDNEEYDDQEN